MEGIKTKGVVISAPRETFVAAFKLWDADRLAGNCMSDEDARALPVDERATTSADAFIDYLVRAGTQNEATLGPEGGAPATPAKT